LHQYKCCGVAMSQSYLSNETGVPVKAPAAPAKSRKSRPSKKKKVESGVEVDRVFGVLAAGTDLHGITNQQEVAGQQAPVQPAEVRVPRKDPNTVTDLLEEDEDEGQLGSLGQDDLEVGNRITGLSHLGADPTLLDQQGRAVRPEKRVYQPSNFGLQECEFDALILDFMKNTYPEYSNFWEFATARAPTIVAARVPDRHPKQLPLSIPATVSNPVTVPTPVLDPVPIHVTVKTRYTPPARRPTQTLGVDAGVQPPPYRAPVSAHRGMAQVATAGRGTAQVAAAVRMGGVQAKLPFVAQSRVQSPPLVPESGHRMMAQVANVGRVGRSHEVMAKSPQFRGPVLSSAKPFQSLRPPLVQGRAPPQQRQMLPSVPMGGRRSTSPYTSDPVYRTSSQSGLGRDPVFKFVGSRPVSGQQLEYEGMYYDQPPPPPGRPPSQGLVSHFPVPRVPPVFNLSAGDEMDWDVDPEQDVDDFDHEELFQPVVKTTHVKLTRPDGTVLEFEAPLSDLVGLESAIVNQPRSSLLASDTDDMHKGVRGGRGSRDDYSSDRLRDRSGSGDDLASVQKPGKVFEGTRCTTDYMGNKVTPEEFRRCVRESLCVYCKVFGHTWTRCPKVKPSVKAAAAVVRQALAEGSHSPPRSDESH